jgi:phosphate starvation-inducible PhoH-like protein
MLFSLGLSNGFILKKAIPTTTRLFGTKKLNFEKKYTAKSPGQINYKSHLYDKNLDILVCSGPAGTGKTALACEYSLDTLHSKNCEKVIITRPTISIEEDLGFLPGDINHKMMPWTAPIYDIFQEYFPKTELDYYIQNKIIEVCPLGFIQGRTFKNAIIIADEMQNSTPSQTLMLLTRIGENSKMILNGDLKQTTIQNNGLYDVINRINLKYPSEDDKYNNGFGVVKLKTEDIQRHPMVEKVIRLYD